MIVTWLRLSSLPAHPNPKQAVLVLWWSTTSKMNEYIYIHQHEQQTIRSGLTKCSATIPKVMFHWKSIFNSILRDCSLKQHKKKKYQFSKRLIVINVVLAADNHQGQSISHSSIHSGHISKKEVNEKYVESKRCLFLTVSSALLGRLEAMGCAKVLNSQQKW